MAEFIEVMRQRKRMCRTYTTCEECPINASVGFCIVSHKANEALEKAVMDWAKAHPEPVYPSWIEWQKAHFPDAQVTICPNTFCAECNDDEVGCMECVQRPIPEQIAKKLGIQPTEGKKGESNEQT